MSRLGLCIKKDQKEYVRSMKLTVSIVFLTAFLLLLILLTAAVPRLASIVSSDVEFVAQGVSALTDFLVNYFPQSLAESSSFFSTEIGLFYSILVIAFSFNVLPKDIKSGRLILPTCNGYKQTEIFLSKQIVYSLFASIPAGVAYFIYYLIGLTFLERNYSVGLAAIGALATTINVFSIVCITIALSVIYKHSVIVIITMGLTVAASPDLLYHLPFGKFIPTYIFSYLNYAINEPIQLLIPIIEYIAIIVILDIIVCKRKFAVVVDERR